MAGARFSRGMTQTRVPDYRDHFENHIIWNSVRTNNHFLAYPSENHDHDVVTYRLHFRKYVGPAEETLPTIVSIVVI
jgi:hypothetical protein